MLLLATSDKGGTGRSVTSSNMLYRRALQGANVCYVDFDFGSPTAGAVLGLSTLARGTDSGRGTHSFISGRSAQSQEYDVWGRSDRRSLRLRPAGSGRLVLVPGDVGGGEFPSEPVYVERCVDLFLRLHEQYDVIVVDLSAGRSYAADMVLAATSSPQLKAVESRWLVFHRWTRQHIIAAAGLVRGPKGLLEGARRHGVDKDFLDRVRYVRTAVVDPRSPALSGLQPSQLAWLIETDNDLHRLATDLGLGEALAIGSIPLDPMLQLQEQLITDDDVWAPHVANRETVEAFEDLAARIDDLGSWERL